MSQDLEQFEQMVRRIMREESAAIAESVWSAQVLPTIDNYTISVDPADPNNAVSWAITTGTTSVDAENAVWIGSPNPMIVGDAPYGARVPESPFNPAYERLLQNLGVPSQSIPIPDGLEMVDCCQIREAKEETATLEFKIKGPTLPKELIKQIPEAMFKRLDYELKMAMIRAFNLVPIQKQPPRMVIIEEQE